MFQKLMEPFKQKGPKISGDLRVTVQQNPVYAANSHLNTLILNCPQGCQFRWLRQGKHQEEVVDNQSNTYQFSLQDVGGLVKAQVQLAHQKSTVVIGPIQVDKSTQQSVLTMLNNNGTKFPVTFLRIRVFENERIAAEARDLNQIGTIGVSEDKIRLQLDMKELCCLVKHQLNGRTLRKTDEGLAIELEQLDHVSFEEVGRLIRSIIGYRLQQEDRVSIELAASSSKQADLLQLGLMMFGAKQVLANLKFVQQLDKVCSGVFEEVTMDGSGDLMLAIASQQEVVSRLGAQLRSSEKEKMQLIKQLNLMEAELETTIQSYQQLMTEHNVGSTLNFQSVGLNKSLGKSSISYRKYLDEQQQQELREMREKLEQLRKVQELEISTNYYSFSREELIRLVCDLEVSWQKAKRLNEILNREVSALKSAQQQETVSQKMHEMQEKIIQYSYQDDLIKEYKQQIIDQKKQIDLLNKKILEWQYQNSSQSQLEEYVRQLQDELETLRSQTEQNVSSFSIEQDLQSETQRVLEENHNLLELVNHLKRKNDSLQQELDSLIRNPKQLTQLQQSYHVIESQRTNNELKSQVSNLQEKCNRLGEELNKYQMQKSTMSSSRSSVQKTEVSRTSTSPARRTSSRSMHGIFDDLPPQPQIRRLANSKNKQNNYSMIQ